MSTFFIRLLGYLKDLIVSFSLNFLSSLPCFLLKFILPKKIVLYGHLVSDSDKCLASQRYKYPSYSEFDFFYKKFRRIGFEFVNFEDFRQSRYKRMVLITFDDGFKEVFNFNQKYKIPFMAFITTDIFNSKVSNFGGIFQEPKSTDFLTLENVKQLKEEGVHIGFHTRSHKKIEGLKDDLDELLMPVKYADLFSHPLTFAYPFESPSNFSEIDSFLFNQGIEYIFDSKSLFENDGRHIYRVSMDINKESKDSNFIERNIYRALISSLYKRLNKLWI